MLICDQQQASQQAAGVLPALNCASLGSSMAAASEAALDTSYTDFSVLNYPPGIDTLHHSQHPQPHQHQLQHQHQHHQMEMAPMSAARPELHHVDALLSASTGLHHHHHHQHLMQHQQTFQQHQHPLPQQDVLVSQYPGYPDDLTANGHHFKLESRSPSDSGEEDYQLQISLQYQQQYDMPQLHQQQQQQPVLPYHQFGALQTFCPGHEQHLPALYFSDFVQHPAQQQQNHHQFTSQTVHPQIPQPPQPPPPPPQLLPLPPAPKSSDADEAGNGSSVGNSCLATNDQPEENAANASPKSSAAVPLGPTDCLVCGDSAACQHYGVRTCEGCKGFFKRTIQKSAQYVCLHAKSCVVDKRRRNRCQYCRFKKCLNVGMVKEVVRSESLKGRRGRLSSKARQQQAGPQPLSQLPALSLLPELTVGQAPQARSRPSIGAGGSPVTLLSVLISAHLATQPAAPSSMSSSPSSADGADIALDDVDLDDDLNSEAIRLCSAIDASLTVVEQFAVQLPGFSSLEAADRVALLRAHALDVVLARTAYRSSIYDFDTREDQSESDNQFRGSRSSYFRLDSGDSFSRRCLARLGLANVAEALTNCSRQLRELLGGDCAAFAGLATILMVYFCPEEESLQLAKPGEVYKQHHNYIEMLKSHCCSQSAASAASAGSSRRDSTFLSRVLQQKSVVRAATRDVLAPSLLAQLGNLLSPRLTDMCSHLSAAPAVWKQSPSNGVDVIDIAANCQAGQSKRIQYDVTYGGATAWQYN